MFAPSRPAPRRSRRRLARRAGFAALTAAGALLLSGCYSITGQTTAQQGTIGDVTVTTELCVLGLASPATPGVEAQCDAGSPGAGQWEFQQFVGYLVPEWVSPPASIAATTSAAGALTLSRSTAYEAALAGPGGAPAPAGRRWIGYASGAQPAIQTSTKTSQQLIAQLGLDERAQAELPLTTVTGWRYVRPAAEGVTALPIERPIVCGTPPVEGAPAEPADEAAASCVASSWPAPPAEGGLANETLALRTLALRAPQPQLVAAGALASLDFGVTSNAAGADAALPVAVETSVPGATVTAPPSVALGASAPLAVKVAVPAGTPAGDYTVTLRTTGAERSATATLTVPAPQLPQAQPGRSIGKPELKAIAQRLATALSKKGAGKQLRGSKFKAALTLPGAGAYDVVIRGNRTRGRKQAPVLARGTVVGAGEGQATLRLKATKDGRKLLGRRGKARPAYILVKRGALQSDAVRTTIRR